VGQIVPPAAVDSLESFGNGAVIPIATAEQATGGGPPPTPDAFLVTFRPGVDRTAALARLDQLFPRTVLVAPSSVDVDTLRHVDWLPVVLAGLVGLVTAGTLVHVVVSNARRRRRELGVLRALGFTGSQVVASVTCMATVLVLGMLLIGLPLGIVAGRAAWTIIADDLGTAALPDVPAPLLLLLVPLGLVVGVVASAWPAWRIIRQPPARATRAE
jgi:predicted lysophospholipase L1 biosynthesis ABC-type transport system permease subunit